MSDLSQVRNIIGDPFLYDRAAAVGDGTTKEYAVPNTPVKPTTETVSVNGVVKADPGDYSLDDGLGLVTFVVTPPLDEDVVITYQHSLLSDAQLQEFLDVETVDSIANVKLASALALDSIASTQALILKKIKVLDLSTDGPALAKALREQAVSLREQDRNDPVFDLAEQITNVPGFVEKVIKDQMREG